MYLSDCVNDDQTNFNICGSCRVLSFVVARPLPDNKSRVTSSPRTSTTDASVPCGEEKRVCHLHSYSVTLTSTPHTPGELLTLLCFLTFFFTHTLVTQIQVSRHVSGPSAYLGSSKFSSTHCRHSLPLYSTPASTSCHSDTGTALESLVFSPVFFLNSAACPLHDHLGWFAFESGLRVLARLLIVGSVSSSRTSSLVLLLLVLFLVLVGSSSGSVLFSPSLDAPLLHLITVSQHWAFKCHQPRSFRWYIACNLMIAGGTFFVRLPTVYKVANF